MIRRCTSDAEHGDDQDRRRRRRAERPAVVDVQPIDRVHAAHDEIGIGDPDHIDHAEDQVEAERKQRQHAAEQQAVDDRLEQIDIHALAQSPI